MPTTQLDETVFDAAYKQASTEEDSQAADDSGTYTNDAGNKEDNVTSQIYADYITPLGTKLQELFFQCENDRRQVEDRWLEDLRQYRGEYATDVLTKMHPKRSKAYLSLTRTKVNTVSAREVDLLFPANGDKNWGIAPTPLPELNPILKQDIIKQMSDIMGQIPSEDQIIKTLDDEAKRRCTNMEREMADQLAELKYRSIISDVIKSGNLFGTGILKGPLIKRKSAKRWLADSNGEWQTVEIKSLLPYCEFVPLWDIYPDMTVRRQEDMRHVFQRYAMNRNKVYELSKREDFNGKAIEAYLRAYPEGDAEYKTHEENLRNLSSGEEAHSVPVRSKKYEVKEFWGYLSADELLSAGIEIPEDQLGLEFAANVWLLGPMVIKCVLSPIEGVTFPYFFYYYNKDETSLFGEGIPYIMRDAQQLFNASVRATLDNAAISAGPIIEANIELLAAGEDPTDLYPFRVFQRTGTGMEAGQRAIHVDQLPSYTNEYMQLVRFFLEMSDELTAVPRYMYGDQSALSGAGKTASGLSMLMGAANITLKDQIKHFDDGITKPFVRALYYWNMQFNPKEAIKGDFSVACKGATSLIAKEVRAESLIQFVQITGNEIDMQYINRDAVLREVTKCLDLDDLGLIKESTQVKMETESRNAQAEEDRQFEKEIATVKAQSGGHMQQDEVPKVNALTPEQVSQGDMPNVG